MTTTYFLTGCAGFIGSNFVLYMLKKYKEDIRLINLDALTYAGNLENLKDVADDPRHIFIKGDIRDKATVSRIMVDYDPDYIINFAAESHVDRSIANPNIFVETNVLGTVNLLQVAKENWYDAASHSWKPGKKYIQVSTDEVYGALGPDGFFTEETALSPHSPYSASKASADHFVKAFHDTYGMPVNITRCSNNYGPFQFPEKMIPLMINNCLGHRSLPVYGDGLQIRDWLYVEDHCKAIDMVARQGKDGEVYNIGGHNEKTNLFIVNTIISHLAERTGDKAINTGLITHVTDRLGHDRRYAIDPSKIKSELSWEPETPFEAGIVKTIDWYLSNPEWVEHATSGAYQSYYEQMYGARTAKTSETGETAHVADSKEARI
ncbi:MAG: dTDP-glucose 4,6-dehydratase [Synergistaceae bacterium]|nr:dTDP-glucose 4,6-dehydratase [Synergistaceae bacterium]